MASDKYKIVVGEKGNTIGHIVNHNAQTDIGAIRALTKALSAYDGDGWGHIVDLSDGYVLKRVEIDR